MGRGSGDEAAEGRVMKGSNDLRINAATMVEAIQMWADATFKERVVVTSVKKDTNNQTEGFIVSFREPQEAEMGVADGP